MAYSTWRKYIASQPQWKIKVTKDPLTATFTHPGLNYTVDRHGLVDIFNVLSHVVDIQSFSLHHTYKDEEEKWFNWGDARKGCSVFASSIEFTMSRDLYNRQLPKWPLESKCILRSVGNSSVAHQMESCIPGSKEPLMKYVVQLVLVDTITRRPKSLPDWFKDKYRDQCLVKTGFQLKTFPRPKKTFVYRRQVMWLDTDINNHTNFGSYVRYALDGLHSAIRYETEQGLASKSHQHGSRSHILVTSNDAPSTKFTGLSTDAILASSNILDTSDEPKSSPISVIDLKNSRGGGLKGITTDDLKRGIKSIRGCYANESLEGDVIDVHIWQEENDTTNIVRCSVERGPLIICQLVIEYFGPLAKL